jgi:aminopeptidase N
VVEAGFADGMEYDGLYFLGREYFAAYDGTPQNYLTALAAHETAHQWWYGLVGNDQALEPWLDEALCTYSELLFYEAVYPDLVDWWWTFRVNRFQPSRLGRQHHLRAPGLSALRRCRLPAWRAVLAGECASRWAMRRLGYC